MTLHPTRIRQIELVWRHRVVYPLLKLILRNSRVVLPLDPATVQSILILRYDRLGDMVVTTPVFRLLKKRYPHMRIGIFASPLNEQIIRFNPWIDTIYILHKQWLPLAREIRRARMDGYDVVLNFIFNRTTSAGLLANLVCPAGKKIGQGHEKYEFYFNSMLQLTRTQQHMADTLVSILDTVFHHPASLEDAEYEIVVDDDSKRAVAKFLLENGLRGRNSGLPGEDFIVHNISATSADRQLSDGQSHAIIRRLLATPKRHVVLIFSPSDASRALEIIRQAANDRCTAFRTSGPTPMLQVAALLGACQAVVTPDTGIIHIASAMKTPVLGFFNEIEMPHEWAPRHVFHRIVVSPGRTSVSTLSVGQIEQEVENFLTELRK